jgi:omega-amidase
MRIIACQLDIVWENKTANFARVRRLLDKAELSEGSLVALPEMFSTGFSMNVPAIREESASETESFLRGLAREYKVFLLGGLVREGADRLGRNEAVVMTPAGETAARYCKIHPFSFGREKQHYTGGSSIVSFEWQQFRVAPFICYDLRFPEIFRLAARDGAQLFVVIANWPAGRVHHWTTLLQARAIENQAYVVGVNRTGKDPKLEYPGRSLIVDPRGAIIADGGPDEGVIGADVDVANVVEWRNEFPALQDMRREFLKED